MTFTQLFCVNCSYYNTVACQHPVAKRIDLVTGLTYQQLPSTQRIGHSNSTSCGEDAVYYQPVKKETK